MRCLHYLTDILTSFPMIPNSWKIEGKLSEIQQLQSLYFLLFNLYFTLYFVHYLRHKLGRQDVPFVVSGHICTCRQSAIKFSWLSTVKILVDTSPNGNQRKVKDETNLICEREISKMRAPAENVHKTVKYGSWKPFFSLLLSVSYFWVILCYKDILEFVWCSCIILVL